MNNARMQVGVIWMRLLPVGAVRLIDAGEEGEYITEVGEH